MLDRIGADDPRYRDLASRGFYGRMTGRPRVIFLPRNSADVVEALEIAVREDLRPAARSGGHCLERFVVDPAIQVVIDTQLMKNVSYDPDMRAIAVEPGVTLGELYRSLFTQWGIVLPAGVAPDVGAGGHILGGGFGYLCRRHGLAVDHLYAVEVATVDAHGRAKLVIATADPSDPDHDLWWAHTGGGGGNFGAVTRYWLRSPDQSGSRPHETLPRAPEEIARFKASWRWDAMNSHAFETLLRNHGHWSEANSEAGAPGADLFSTLMITRRAQEKIELTGVAFGDGANALAQSHIDAVCQNVGAAPSVETDTPSWLEFALFPFPEMVKTSPKPALLKLKDALLNRGLSDRQIGCAYDLLGGESRSDVSGSLGLATLGGAMKTRASTDTAFVHRDAILTMSCNASWAKPEDEAQHLAWVRAFYGAMFAETGGVPHGALINHADAELADETKNRSGTQWSEIYYGENYARLQSVKARWDPRNVFHHALSISHHED